jgi:hypothetical protein
MARPCGVSYHTECIRAGAPFTTRLPNGRGLSYPRKVPIPHFICECCQVRALLQRELLRTGRDTVLLMLERMRMIDVVGNWKHSTLAQYAPALRNLQRFEKWSGIPTLTPTRLAHPPVSPVFGLAYAQLRNTIPRPDSDTGPSFNSSRKLRSAASMWYNMDLQMCHPTQAVRDHQRRSFRTLGTVPTDSMTYTFLNGGMARRMGTATRPSWALSHVHIAYIDQRLEVLFRSATSQAAQHEIAVAASVNLTAWLGWLRGNEVFGLHHADIKITTPENGKYLGLAAGVGALELRLAPDTKSDPTRTADVVIAYTTATGLSLGKWLTRLLQFPPTTTGFLFSTTTRRVWSSAYFRREYAVPFLEELRLTGEPTLQVFAAREGHRIHNKVWSMHSWRRGGRSKATKTPRAGDPRPPGARRASTDEISEHGRWRQRFRAEAMEVHYNEWDVVDRISITLFCM